MQSFDPISPIDGLIQQMQNKLLAWLAIREHGDLELRQKFLRSFEPQIAALNEQDWENWQNSPQNAEAAAEILSLGDWRSAESWWQWVLQKAQAENWQSDDRYIESFVRQAMEKGQGPYKIRHTLQQRSSRQDLIDAYLEMDEADWIELAKAVLQKKYGDSSPQNRNEQAKRMRFLQSRGFSQNQIWQCFK